MIILTQMMFWCAMQATTIRQHELAAEKKWQDVLEELSVTNHHFSTIFSLSLEKRDAYTAIHSKRVAQYAYQVARELGIDPRKHHLIYLGGLLHDIGKIGIPDRVLNKQGSLTDEEFLIVKQHPLIGEELLRRAYQATPFIREDERETIIDIVLYHHERPDGKGYPRGLAEEQIPVWSKITAVADAYDAMTSNRSYRTAMTSEQAIGILRRGAGTQFWQPAVEALARITQIEE